MLLQPGSTGPFTRLVCGGEIISFSQGLDVSGQVSGLLQNSGAGVCFAKIVYVPLMNQEPDMQSGANNLFPHAVYNLLTHAVWGGKRTAGIFGSFGDYLLLFSQGSLPSNQLMEPLSLFG